MTGHQRINYLLDQYINGLCTEGEKDELTQLVRQAEYDDTIRQHMEAAWASLTEKHTLNDQQSNQILFNIIDVTPAFSIREEGEEETPKYRRMFPPNPVRGRRIAVAASIILLLGVGTYFLFFNNSGKPNDIVKTTVPNDVKAPVSNRAMITLANGDVIHLDNAVNGTLATQNNITVTKTADGKIIYTGLQPAAQSSQLSFNTLTNPRGSKVIDMTLADGSRVWLNAESSVTYPVAFAGNERKVTITGEAYFEVAHNTAMPFKVNKGETEVTVLGTHFNINAYEDEENVKVTLLKGSVQVRKGKSEKLLKPGQQAQVNGSIEVKSNVNVEEVMVWKNGYFHFNRADIPTIMRQLARWYDLEVVYEGNVPKQEFGGEMQRDLPLSSIIRLLEKTKIHFRIEGKKLTVLP